MHVNYRIYDMLVSVNIAIVTTIPQLAFNPFLPGRQNYIDIKKSPLCLFQKKVLASQQQAAICSGAMNIFAVAGHALFALHVWGTPLVYYPIPGVYKSMNRQHQSMQYIVHACKLILILTEFAIYINNLTLKIMFHCGFWLSYFLLQEMSSTHEKS